MTRAFVANGSGVALRTLTRIENEEATQCGMETLVLLSQFFGVNPNDLVIQSPDTIGARCYRELSFKRTILNTLTKIKADLGCDRIRLYRCNHEAATFEGVVELGGCPDSFSKTKLTKLTDPLSLVLLAGEYWCLRCKRPNGGLRVTVHGIRIDDVRFVPVEGYQCLLAHDHPSIGRSSLERWYDVALIHGSKLVGKLSIDSAARYSIGLREPSLEDLDVIQELQCDSQILGAQLADYLGGKYECRELSAEAYTQAERYFQVSDVVSTLLVSLKAEPALRGLFDRARLWMCKEEHDALFGTLMREANWQRNGPTVQFVGFVESGGVESVFTDQCLEWAADECTKVITGRSTTHAWSNHHGLEYYRDTFLDGNAIVFTTLPAAEEASPVQCHVEQFHSPWTFGRELPPSEGRSDVPKAILWHVDLPILAHGREWPLAAKVTLDAKWSNPSEPPSIGKEGSRELAKYGRKLAEALQMARDLPDPALQKIANATLSPRNDIFLC